MVPRILWWVGLLIAGIAYLANIVYINSPAGHAVLAQGPVVTMRMQRAFWFVIYLGIALFAVGTCWRFLKRSGGLQFWKVAARYPDAAYEWFRKEDCWVVLDPSSPDAWEVPEPREDFTGPFGLTIPKLGGRRIAVYCRHDKIEDSQRRFLEHYGPASSRLSKRLLAANPPEMTKPECDWFGRPISTEEERPPETPIDRPSTMPSSTPAESPRPRPRFRRREIDEPHPWMLLLANHDGTLKPDPEVQEWAADLGDLQACSLVPVWWPWRVENQQLGELDRKEWFEAELELALSRLDPKTGRSIPPTAESLTPLAVVRSILQLRFLLDQGPTPTFD